jgi:hypothetical protein
MRTAATLATSLFGVLAHVGGKTFVLLQTHHPAF